MDELNNQNMLQVGTILHGTYKIESYLSSGGFGNTYLAKNIEFDETYAIKEFFVKGVCQRDGNSTTISVSNAENTNSFEQQREKFKKEARRLRSLSNPHIVKVYDLFEENGTAYYVMDYVDGENLSVRLKRTNAPLAESEVRNYLNQILDGLEAIHNEGMFHLDIKPANIMVDSHDVVKLIDFGASKQQSTVGGATMSTGISYTNGYAPSEQMAQSYDKFGPWTDFYALRATMYKLLTNQDPPSVSDLSEDETEDKHLALPMPNVSEEMKKMVVWMMGVNRMKRPKNVEEIRNFLNLSSSATSNNEEKRAYSSYQTSANSVGDDEETVWVGRAKQAKVEENNQRSSRIEEQANEASLNKFKYFAVVYSLGLVVICAIAFMIYGYGNSTASNVNNVTADSDSVYVESKNEIGDLVSQIQFVDLGLSVCWASSNVGSDMAYNLGIPFTKNDIVQRLNNKAERLPTKEEFEELLEKCTWERTTLEGQIGYKVIGKNGNSIFFPACSSKSDNFMENALGFYWASTPQTEYEDNSWELELTDLQNDVGWWFNSSKRSVRLVR